MRTAIFPWRAGWAAANRFGLLGEPQVGSSPHLDAEALRRWRKLANSADVYLEYGSGGSTVEAIQHAKHVMSVETDERYLMAVARKIAEFPAPLAEFHAIHASIGWTEKWGRPLIAIPTGKRLRRWRDYTSAPWLLLNRLGLVPDFVFVDGRFRAASVLDSFLRLPDAADCLFMLDDFEGREGSYSIVLDFAVDVESVGRGLVFRRAKDFDRSRCSKLLVAAQMDPE